MTPYCSYQDVLLVPNYSELGSRDLADVSVEFLGSKFKLPVIPANMESVIDTDIAHFLSQNGYFYIMHRFGSTLDFVKKATIEAWELISASVGVNENENELKELSNWEIHYLTIDLAHAHHLKVKERIKLLKKVFPTSKLIVGNVSTPEAICDLTEWGADAIKVGIGQGSICTTRLQTGFSIPMFSCVQNCCGTHFWPNNGYKEIPNTPIIADGSVQNIGDVSKALVAGARMVMCGGLFASCSDSPAKIRDGKKVYFGSTSFEAKGHRKHIEGKAIEVPMGLCYKERLEEISDSLKSAISYAGGKDLSAFGNVETIIYGKN